MVYDPSSSLSAGGLFGACQFPSTLDLINSKMVASLNTKQWEGTKMCGMCIQVTSKLTGLSVITMVTDECVECLPGSISISTAAYETLSSPEAGELSVAWSEVPCPNSTLQLSHDTVSNAKLFKTSLQSSLSPSLPSQINIRWSSDSAENFYSFQIYGTSLAVYHLEIKSINPLSEIGYDWNFIRRRPTTGMFEITGMAGDSFILRITFRDGTIAVTSPIPFFHTGLVSIDHYQAFGGSPVTIVHDDSGKIEIAPNVNTAAAFYKDYASSTIQNQPTQAASSSSSEPVDGNPKLFSFLSKPQNTAPSCLIGLSLKVTWTTTTSFNASITLTALTSVPKGWILSFSLNGRNSRVIDYNYAESGVILLKGIVGLYSSSNAVTTGPDSSFYQFQSVQGSFDAQQTIGTFYFDAIIPSQESSSDSSWPVHAMVNCQTA